MDFLLYLGAAFAAIEGVAVATSGVDVFYPVPIADNARALPAIEWFAGAVLLSVAGLRASGATQLPY